MEKIIEQNLLYDFYGELLTEHQRKVYENAVYNDLSLSEIEKLISKSTDTTLKAVGLDIGGCDVRIQSNKNDNPKFIVVEINSACSQGEITSQEYIKAFRDIVKFKSKS